MQALSFYSLTTEERRRCEELSSAYRSALEDWSTMNSVERDGGDVLPNLRLPGSSGIVHQVVGTRRIKATAKRLQSFVASLATKYGADCIDWDTFPETPTVAD